MESLVPELTDESVMQRYCVKSKGWCFIAVIPDDLETMEANIEVMRAAAQRRYPVQLPSQFLWVHAGLEQT